MPRDLPEDDDWIRARQQMIGLRVQSVRLRQNLTQEDVYLSAGIDRRTLQAIEAGRGNPTLTILLKIAHVLGTPLPDLVR